ncbi:hypothetical protein BDZ85DRAFT_268446 [Elsinoe ampelina]|uniref:Uncharacterized protein n=1 Tax=Elsinoe ampelina TaxID=302913 RepID=A0A6A6G1N5_9PEZI|nr:hypothetical protein BDZ85DRAFT_268446 [Elsinoe ampelina]
MTTTIPPYLPTSGSSIDNYMQVQAKPTWLKDSSTTPLPATEHVHRRSPILLGHSPPRSCVPII